MNKLIVISAQISKFIFKEFPYTFRTFLCMKKWSLQKFRTHSGHFFVWKNDPSKNSVHILDISLYEKKLSVHILDIWTSLNSKLDHFLGQKVVIFRTYSYIPGQIPDIFDDNFRTFPFYRAVYIIKIFVKYPPKSCDYI